MLSKSIFTAAVVFVLLVACSSAKVSKSIVLVDLTNEDYVAGLGEIAKSDCITCHKVHENLTGPSFLNVANKYDRTSENILKLTTKIIDGGKGSWGKVPMVPHKDISPEIAEKMVKYILLLKTN